MANNILLDTNGWIALLHSGDARHSEAEKIWQGLIRGGARVVVTDWIIAETGNGSARSQHRSQVVEAVYATINHPRVDLVIIDEDLLRRSLDFFGRHQDKSWGLVDCASFLVMQDRGLSVAFTSDRHFEQAGFQCLLAI